MVQSVVAVVFVAVVYDGEELSVLREPDLVGDVGLASGMVQACCLFATARTHTNRSGGDLGDQRSAISSAEMG